MSKRLLGLLSQGSQFLFFQKNSFLQQLEQLELQEEELLTNIEKNEDEIKVKNYAIELLEMLKDYKLKSRKDTILNIINTVLKDIFEDAIYIDIEQEVSKSGAIKYNIVFYQQGIPIAKNDELLDSNGGGILAVISMLFKVLIGYLYSKNRLYIFDESFAQVSPQYRERLSLFLRQFAEKYNFTIILVSQTSDLNKFAHIEYNVNYKYDDKGIKELYIEDKRENRNEIKDKLDRYELEIKNFQSIRKIKFEYQGFTVISGPNNSGKSASLRALKAIIFNDFKDKYQRINSKVTEIILRKISNSDIQEIKLIYKSKKVIFEIEGKQYLGKNLAADILKEYLEKKFGLRFINIKNLYKNIKGDLRKQVEHIAYNSQHDSLFLIGSKSNDVEKIFNFLFNTETITIAISQLKEEIYEINDVLKEQKKRLDELKYEISQINFELKFIDTLYKIKLIKEFFNNLNLLNNSKQEITLLNQELKNVSKYIETIQIYSSWINYFNVYFQNLKTFENNKNVISELNAELNNLIAQRENIEILYNKYNEIYHYIQNIENQINNILNSEQEIKNIQNQINYLKNIDFSLINNLEQKYYDYIQILNYIRNINDLTKTYQENALLFDQLKQQLEIINNNLTEELEQLGVVKCSCCNGFGYHKK